MPVLFKTKQAKRKDELRELLELGVVNKKGKFQAVRMFIFEHFKIILLVLFLVISLISHVYYFNKLMIMEQQVINMRAQIESALQMRQNLVPSLTMVVYQFINHEKNVFLSAVEARQNSLAISGDLNNLIKGLKGITGQDFSSEALSRFMAVAENYPQLVSSQSYQLLIAQISDVENQIYSKRIAYNDAVNIYNTRLSMFPVNIMGRIMGFRLQPYFEWKNKAEWVFVTNLEEGELPVSMEIETRNQ